MKSKTFVIMITLFCLFGLSQAFEVINTSTPENPAGMPLTWYPEDRPVPYFFHQNGTPDVSGTEEFNQLKTSLQKWNNVSKLKFQYAGTTSSVRSGDAKNGIVFDQNFDGDSSILAYMETYYGISQPNRRFEGDLHFNDRDFRWTTGASNSQANAYKILPTAVHEIGHSVGLGHTAVFDATMFFADQGDDRGETLHQDDIQGAKFLYNGPFNTLTVPRLITPLNNTLHTLLIGTGTQAAQGLTFRWIQSKTNDLSSFALEFAADSAFTMNKKRYAAGAKEGMYIQPGTKLNALKNIQAASPTGTIYWRVTAKNGAGITVTSQVRSFKIGSL